ncbi:50S ribosomal protein L23 [Acidobacteria bacterium AH-259-G07]|nr:50S ribosomal protein L23 [Acidobacteria bacterium AH-259-G07]
MTTNIHDILRYPHVTEKSTLEKEKSDGRVVAFRVRKGATKRHIKEAVEKIFDVQVEKVRTANFEGKIKRQGRNRGRRPSWKKAYITLKAGQKSIEFFEGV